MALKNNWYIKHHAMKKYGSVYVQVHGLLPLTEVRSVLCSRHLLNTWQNIRVGRLALTSHAGSSNDQQNYCPSRESNLGQPAANLTYK
jgi:hypothetical protein